jgi:multidrug efflux system outer membrane protein
MENQNIVIQSLVTGVAQSYFQLRELDEELEISHKTLDSRIESLKLVKMRQEFGASSMSDVRQAESLVQSARHAIPLLEQAIAQQENAINIVLGRYQGPVPRGLRLDDQRLSVTVPPGLPSTLLDRRPDVRMAEQKLVAANAQIGVAKAAYFPSISLTGSKGYASSELQQLMTPGASIWNVGTTLTAPVFQGGRIQQNVKLTELQKDELVLEYTKTLQQAFVDVSNSLVSIEKTAQAREEQQVFTATLEEQKALAKMRYEGGVAAYLEVLDSERECFDAQRGLAQAKRDELLSIISLYKSLGGGWKEAAEGKNGATP